MSPVQYIHLIVVLMHSDCEWHINAAVYKIRHNFQCSNACTCPGLVWLSSWVKSWQQVGSVWTLSCEIKIFIAFLCTFEIWLHLNRSRLPTRLTNGINCLHQVSQLQWRTDKESLEDHRRTGPDHRPLKDQRFSSGKFRVICSKKIYFRFLKL